MSPYKQQLEKYKNEKVVLHRAEAPNIEGIVYKVEDDGCTLRVAHTSIIMHIFVAYRDIRGIEIVN